MTNDRQLAAFETADEQAWSGMADGFAHMPQDARGEMAMTLGTMCPQCMRELPDDKLASIARLASMAMAEIDTRLLRRELEASEQ